jgi:glycerol uptake facilitator-like aquaporin
MTTRAKVAMLAAEFVGTSVLAMSAINVARSQIGIGYFIAFSVAITYALLVLTLGSTSGGHFNPIVTIGLWTLRKVQTLQAIAYVAVQMLGGLVAWKVTEYFTGSALSNIAGENFDWKILVAEALGAFIFTFAVAAAVYQRFEGSKLAAAIGMAFFVGTILASLASNAVLNPAVALGDQSWSRAYIFGPLLGSLLGMNLYALLFSPRAAERSVVVASTPAVASPKAGRKTTASRAKTTRKKPAAKTTRRRK